MAKELAYFKNFAKLKDTSLEFNDITVLAGKPSTGKSYVMKFMYAVNKALDLTKYEFINIQKKFNMLTLNYIKLTENTKNNPPKSIIDAHNIENTLDSFSNEYTEIVSEVKKLDNKIKYLVKDNFKNIIQSIFGNIEQVSKNFEIGSDFLNIVYKENVLENFDIKLSIDLSNKNKNIFPIVYSDFSMYEKQFQQEPVFVETPLILEFKSFIRRDKGKVPYHIESLLNVLDTDYSFTDEEQDRFIQNFTKKVKEIILGDIESSGDSFVYRTDTKNYDILNTSSGIKSIGLLQYLVTNKALKKGSILFWEEPEVHLHPQWQLKMIDLFVELMRAGVKIVFSTHSPYMADYLNAISQKNGFKDRVSFNLLKEQDGIVENIILNDDNWKEIQAELLDPLEEIMWEYI